MNHETVEKKVGLLGVLIAIVISIGGLVEIVPLYCRSSRSSSPRPGIKPYDAARARGTRHLRARRLLQLPFADGPPAPAETERYGHYSLAGEVGLRPSVPVRLEAHRPGSRARRRALHRRMASRAPDRIRATSCPNRTCRLPVARDERASTPRSTAAEDAGAAQDRRALHRRGHRGRRGRGCRGPTEMDALIAYLQGLGRRRRARRGSLSLDIGICPRSDHASPCSWRSWRWGSGPGAASAASDFRRAGALPLEDDPTARSGARPMTTVEPVRDRLHARQHPRVRLAACGGRQAADDRKVRASDKTGHVWDGDLRGVQQPAAALVALACSSSRSCSALRISLCSRASAISPA